MSVVIANVIGLGHGWQTASSCTEGEEEGDDGQGEGQVGESRERENRYFSRGLRTVALHFHRIAIKKVSQ